MCIYERTKIHNFKWLQWLLKTFTKGIIISDWIILKARIWEKTLIHQHFYFHRCKYLSFSHLLIKSPSHHVIGHTICFFVYHQSLWRKTNITRMLWLSIHLRMLAKRVISRYILLKLIITTLFIFRHKDVEFVIPGSKRMSSSTTCLYQGTYNAPGSSRRNSQLPLNVSGRNISMIITFKSLKWSKYKLTHLCYTFLDSWQRSRG